VAEWTPDQLTESFRAQKIEPLYLFYGEESFLIEESLRQIRSAVLAEGLEDFNYDVFYGHQLEVFQVKDAVETLPMMSSQRVVVLRDAQELKDSQWQALDELIVNPIDTTVFVVLATKVDKRKKFFKSFSKNGVIVEFKRLYDDQVVGWIRTLSKREGIALEPSAAQLLHQLVGNNLSELQSELVKVAQFLGERKLATAEDILEVVSRVRMESVFELTAAIGSQDQVRALMCLVQLLEYGQNEVGVLSLVTRHLRILKALKQGLREGLSGPKLSARAGVPHYFLRTYLEQAKQWSDKKLENGFRALLETDRALKSSPVSGHIWLENFILQACN
jgi:DNA polymerase-3 subunit delta